MRAYLTQELGCPTHPLTLLLHCFNEIINPKLLGGTINSGCANGVDVAKYSNARCWISAHDEDIETSGLSVRWLKGKRYDVEQVQGLLDTHGRGGEGTMVNGDETVWGEKGKQGGTRAVALNSGMSLTLGT